MKLLYNKEVKLIREKKKRAISTGNTDNPTELVETELIQLVNFFI